MEKIFGVITHVAEHGVQAYAVSEDGYIISSHFCSDESFAKSDLGFGAPLLEKNVNDDQHSTAVFNNRMKEKYDNLFPKGYELIWLGIDHDIDIKETEYADREREKAGKVAMSN